MKVKTSRSSRQGGLTARQVSEGENRLLKASMKTIRDEARLWLLRNLLSKNLATPDIYDFIKNQAGLRYTHKGPELDTMRCAMRMKVKDVKTSLALGYTTRKKMMKDYIKDLNCGKYSTRKRIRKIIRISPASKRENI